MYWKCVEKKNIHPPVFTNSIQQCLADTLPLQRFCKERSYIFRVFTSEMRFPELCQQTTTISHKTKKLGNLAVKVPQHVVVSWFCCHLVGCLVEDLTVPKPMVGKLSSWKDFLTWIQLSWYFLVKMVKPKPRNPALQRDKMKPMETAECRRGSMVQATQHGPKNQQLKLKNSTVSKWLCLKLQAENHLKPY